MYNKYMNCPECGCIFDQWIKHEDQKRKSFYERFWEKVDIRGPDECWPWLGCLNSRGYGLIRVHEYNSEAPSLATRVMMVMKTGKPIEENLFVLHACDNPTCVNPAHLRWGTAQDNIDDMMRRGRHPRLPILRYRPHFQLRLPL